VAVTGRERVRAALALDVADRPPVSAWGHAYDQEWDVGTLAASTVSAAREHQVDFVKLQVRMTCFAEAFGAEWRYSGSPDAEPVMIRSGGHDATAWRRIAEGPVRPARLADQVETLRRVAGELGDGTPVIQTVFSPGMVAWFLAGRDTAVLSGLMRDEPHVLKAGLDAIARTLADFTTNSLAAGASGVFYAINPLADTTVLSPEDYRRTYLPSDLVAAGAAAGGWFNMLHLCGGHINLAPAHELQMHCLNWSIDDAGNPGLAAVRDRLHLAVAGGVNRYAPIRDSAPGVRAAAAAAMAQTGGRGLLLTPGCSSSPWPNVRPENIAALLAAAGA